MKKLFTLFAVVTVSLLAMAEDNKWGLEGAGTAENPYKISTADDFAKLAANISADNTGAGEFFELTADVDFGGSEDNPVQFPAIGRDAITNISTVAYGFDGTFDGKNHIVKGIWHNITGNEKNGQFQALFSSLGAQGTIKNLVFDESNYVSAYNYTAPFASISKGNIENCTNNADITAANAFAAGICGYFAAGTGVVSNCINNGDVTAMTYAVGIVSGSQSGGSIASYEEYIVENCINNGNMSTANGLGSAGIVGTFSGIIRGCTNYGKIDDSAKSTGQYTAGIVASASYLVTLENCTNEGDILGNKNIGGVIGMVMKGDDADVTINGCTNKGKVTATGENVGGIIGNTQRTTGVITLTNCSNNGVVSTTAETELIGNLRGNAAIVLGEGNTIAEGLEHLALDPDVETGINTAITSAGVKDGKYLLNGKIMIVKGGKAYNIAGTIEK